MGGVHTYEHNELNGKSGEDPNTGMSTWSAPHALASFDRPAETISLVEVWILDNAPTAGNPSFSINVQGSPWDSNWGNCDVGLFAGHKLPPVNPVDKWQGSTCGGGESTWDGWGSTKGHRERGNYVFADGHAKALLFPQIRGNDFFLFKLQKPTQTFVP